MKQQTLDLVRGDQLGILRSARLPDTDPGDGRNVAAITLKAVLQAIDSRAGKGGTCWASLDTLAADVNASRRTVSRALKALDLLGLLIVREERDGRRWIVHRRVCWSNLMTYVPGTRDVPECNSPIDSGSEGNGRSSEGNGRSSEGNGRSSEGNGRSSEGNTTHSGGQPVPPKRIHEGAKNETPKRPAGGHEVSEKCQGGEETLRSNLTTADLIDPVTLAELWRIVTRRRWLPDTALWRLTFYALAHSIHRNRAAFTNPVGMFHTKLRDGPGAIHRQVDDEHDRAWAKRVIDQLDGREPATRPAMSADPDAIRIREFEANRRRQQIALAAMMKGER